jgi:peptidoglycan-N-acetylglucosamine deacetylase
LRIHDAPSKVLGRMRRVRWAMIDRIAHASRHAPEGSVALTFDDGPHPSSTPRFLEVLAELKVSATFFCVGRNAERYPDIIRQILDGGHSVGSHSFSHPHPARTPIRELSREYREGRDAVDEAIGRKSLLFRPPHGHLGYASSLMVRRKMRNVWLWTVDPQDWRPGVSSHSVEQVACTAGSGDVVLLHDWVEQPWSAEALDRSATLAALPAIVQSVRERGLRLTALPM